MVWAISSDGLVVTQSNGVAGRNLHLAIRDKALSSAMRIMSELGLTPRHRKAPPRPIDRAMTQFLLGPKYSSHAVDSQE
jgi:phage terminase small subunit